MDRHTTQPLIVTLVMAIVLVGIATTGTARGDDPNAQESLVASWESVTLAVTAYNPAENPDIDPLTRKNVITVSGKVYTVDSNDLVAISTTNPAALQAFDPEGLAVAFDPNLPEPNLARTWQLGEHAKGYCVELRLDSDQTVPTSLSQLDFTVDALYGQPFSTMDMAPRVSGDWIEVTPSYRVHVDEANEVNDVCPIVGTAEATDVSDTRGRDFDPNGTWQEDIDWRGAIYRVSDYDIIARAEVIDIAETPSWNGFRISRSSHRTDDGGFDLSWKFVLQNCTGLENLLIRHSVVVYPYEVAIPLTVTNVTVPDL